MTSTELKAPAETSTSDSEPTTSPPWPRNYRIAIWSFAVCYLVAFVCFLGNSSLWLDETITAWCTAGDLRTCIQRVWDYQGQSPLYFILVWGIRQILGSSELALRSLSLVSVIGCVAIFPAILRRLGLQRDAWVGPVVVLAAMLGEFHAALNARPYSIAIFCSLVSLYCLLRWIDSRSWMTWLAYVAATLLTLVFHYLFGTFLALHLFVLWKRTGGDRRALLAWVGSLCVVGVGLTPVLPHVLLVAEKAKRYEFSAPPTFLGTLQNLFVINGMAPLIGLTCVFGLFKPRLNLKAVDRDMALLGVMYWAAAPLCIAVLYVVLGISLNAPRYLLWRLPAMGLLVIAALQAIYAHRLVALPAILCVAFVLPVFQFHDRSGWKEAAEWAAPYTSSEDHYQVVFYSGLIETATQEWLEDEEFRKYLLAPLDYYGNSQDAELLPTYVQRTQEMFQQKIDDLTGHHDRLIFFLNREPDASDAVGKLLADAGYKIIDGRSFEFVEMIVASRVAGDAAKAHADSD